MKRFLAVVLVALMAWTGSAAAYGGRVCACDPDPPRGSGGGMPSIEVGGQTFRQLPNGIWVTANTYAEIQAVVQEAKIVAVEGKMAMWDGMTRELIRWALVGLSLGKGIQVVMEDRDHWPEALVEFLKAYK